MNYNEDFLIRCTSFEDRKSVYIDCLFGKHKVLADDYRDCFLLDDYEEYPHILWESDGERFMSHHNDTRQETIFSSSEFRKLMGTKKEGCGSKLIFNL